MTILAGNIDNGPQCCWLHRDKWAAEQEPGTLGPFGDQVFLVCDKCGNKRCPKATDCSLDCTNSNAPGQTGSIYDTPKDPS